jgi:hypothetical protein
MIESQTHPAKVKSVKIRSLHDERSFGIVLRDSIKEGMVKVLGAGGAQAMFYYLGLPDLDSPTRFHERLESVFGSGAPSLERVILEEIYQKIGAIPSMQDDDFVGQIERARRHYETAGQTEGDSGRGR